VKRFASALLLGARVLTLAPAAFAAEPEARDPQREVEDLHPPRPIATPIVSDAPERVVDVVLELVIDASGRVVDVIARDGPEPFRSRAAEAASSFVFQPARRGVTPVAARIRFLVRFEPEPLTEATSATIPPDPTPSDPSSGVRPLAREQSENPPARSPPQAPTEVVVLGTRPARVVNIITRVESRELPGSFGDPLRALESSPGVTPIFSGVPFFFVRGAPPGNVGFYLDGVRLPLLYHAVVGPSVIHPGIIERVSFYPGVAPLRFGGFAGPTVSVTTREPSGSLTAEGNLRLFDAGALLEAPILNGRGSLLAGGRYSYTGALVSRFTDADFAYWDYTARTTVDLGASSTLGVFVLGAYDRFEGEGVTSRGGGTQFHRADIRYDVRGSGSRSRLALTVGYDRTAAVAGDLSNRSLALRASRLQSLMPGLAATGGIEARVERYSLNIDPSSPDAGDVSGLFPSRTDVSAGAHLELSWSLTPALTIAPGVRADTYRVGKETASAIDPRIVMQLEPARGIGITQTLGLAHQLPSFVPQLPAAQVGTLRGGLQKAILASSGFAFQLPFDLSLGVTAFRTEFWDLLDPIGRDRDFRLDRTAPERRERGSAMGLEVEMRRPFTRRLSGFLAYTLSKTTRQSGVRDSLAGFDRTHVFSGALAAELGAGWRAGARVSLYSGIPGLLLARDASRNRYLNSLRAPPFFRLDWRLEKRWPLFRRGYWAAVVEVLNSTFSQEVTARTCSAWRCIDTVSGPLTIPSIGLEAFY
jgi:hypothetical protein